MMKRKLLQFIALMLFSTIAQAQYYGVVNYDLNATSTPYVTMDGVESTNTITYDGSGITITDDGNALALNQAAGSVIANLDSHGAEMRNGNTITMKVANKANITFSVCAYGQGGTYTFTDESDAVVGAIVDNDRGADKFNLTFPYVGTSQTLTATLTTTGKAYLHSISIENIESLPSLNGKTQVWDFGAEQLADANILNMLDAAAINAWYPGVTAGTTGELMPQTFTSDVLTWVGKPTADRLRSTNTDLTRYDSKDKTGYTGYLYANGTVTVTDGLPNNRYFRIELEQDDEVTVVDMGNNAAASMTFVYEDDVTVQNDHAAAAVGTPTECNFVAKQAGNYLIFDAADKLSTFRISRKNAEFVTISGAVDETLATSIPSGYGIVFTNTVTGKEWTAVVATQAYSIDLPAGHTYDVSLSDANGYVINSTNTIDVTAAATFDLVVEQISLNTLSGNVTDLGTDISNLNLVFAAVPVKVYVPEVSIDAGAGTYSVVLEPDVEYTITAEGVNDYVIGTSSITITADHTLDLVFATKPVYDINISTTGLTATQADLLQLTFTNLNEEGYVYNFAIADAIQLRDGVYAVATSGLDDYAVIMDLTSNLAVSGSATAKELAFSEVTEWSFSDRDISGSSYLGLLFTGTGTVGSQSAKGHLMAKDGDIISVPAKVGQKMIVTYYYNADFSIDGGTAITTGSGSTSTYETTEYLYPGVTDGTIAITAGSTYATTYITNIEVLDVVAYTATITVGVDKDYQTINEALAAVKLMERTSEQRVDIVIDPGNYEEMLVIDVANVSFTNASFAPSIALKDAGVNIDANAVRITSYYGHGYNYYSMSNDQKWHADVLAVNIANGYISYENKGAGTTNGSFWNATVVVTADGFEANNIIFENSFNQYISAKEAADVVEWVSGTMGDRPTVEGNTEVQAKTYVERAAALAINGGDKTVLNNCRIVGHQDSFYGSQNSRVAVYKGSMMGTTDYIFGGMIAVFYKSDLALLNSDDADGNDVSYIVAPQQAGGRGYLMYECTVTSAEPTVDMVNTQRSKPGFFGRPWAPTTSEAVFYNTTIETTDATGHDGESLIQPLGWLNSLSGESAGMYEYNSTEVSGVDNSGSRATWATSLTAPTLNDATEITTLNFTQGSDGWDPIETLIANDPSTAIAPAVKGSTIQVYASQSEIIVSNVAEKTIVKVYNTQGVAVKSFLTNEDTRFVMPNGCWIVNVTDQTASKSVKVLTM